MTDTGTAAYADDQPDGTSRAVWRDTIGRRRYRAGFPTHAAALEYARDRAAIVEAERDSADAAALHKGS